MYNNKSPSIQKDDRATQDEAPAPRKPAMASAVNELQAELEHCSNALDHLEKKLAPIVAQIPRPCEEKPGEKSPVVLPELVQVIKNSADFATQIAFRVERISREIEI